MTPDDIGYLQEPYQKTDDPEYETNPTPQPRQNVLFEAGMAMGRYPERTVFVHLGELRPFSDIQGRHIVRINNSVAWRQELAKRLETIGCPINISGDDWHTVGEFPIPKFEGLEEITPSTPEATPPEIEEIALEILKISSEQPNDSLELNHYAIRLKISQAKCKHQINFLCKRGYLKSFLGMSDAITYYDITPEGLDYLADRNLI